MSGHKLVLIGLGHVGDAVLSNAMSAHLFSEIALIDANQKLAAGQALDQHQATALPGIGNINVYAADYSSCRDADLIIFTAGPSISADQAGDNARNLLAEKNAGIIRSIMAQIVRYTRDAVLILVSNPVDLLVHTAATEFDYPVDKILGTGTLLDSARLCRLIADRLSIDPDFVRALMLGEHGATGFPYMSGISVAGVKYDRLGQVFAVDLPTREDLMKKTTRGGMDVLEAKGWTSAGVAASTMTLADSIMMNTKIVVPVSCLLTGQYGHHQDVSLSLPAVIGKNGIEKRLQVPFDDWEGECFEKSVKAVQAVIDSVRR